jgi:hypothetical protein
MLRLKIAEKTATDKLFRKDVYWAWIIWQSRWILIFVQSRTETNLDDLNILLNANNLCRWWIERVNRSIQAIRSEQVTGAERDTHFCPRKSRRSRTETRKHQFTHFLRNSFRCTLIAFERLTSAGFKGTAYVLDFLNVVEPGFKIWLDFWLERHFNRCEVFQ